MLNPQPVLTPTCWCSLIKKTQILCLDYSSLFLTKENVFLAIVIRTKVAVPRLQTLRSELFDCEPYFNPDLVILRSSDEFIMASNFRLLCKFPFSCRSMRFSLFLVQSEFMWLHHSLGDGSCVSCLALQALSALLALNPLQTIGPAANGRCRH